MFLEISQNSNENTFKKTSKLYGPLLWMGFNCLKARATLRKQFTFYHYVPRNSWYSFYRYTCARVSILIKLQAKPEKKTFYRTPPYEHFGPLDMESRLSVEGWYSRWQCILSSTNVPTCQLSKTLYMTETLNINY